MPISVTMPQLGESVTEGTVTRWLKNVGDTVVADEPLLEVSTDKVDTEIPAPASGVLLSIAAEVDATVPVGAELAVIGDSSAASQDAPAPAATPAAAAPVAAAPASGGATVAIVLPALGESVTEGTVTRWLKSVGDTIAVDEPILEISTDKVDTELPSPAAGVLTEITVNVDDTAPVGAQLGVIATGVAPAPAPAAPAPAAPAPVSTPAPAPAAPAAASPAPAPAENADAYVTPLVRRLASQHGVDLSKVTGTGVGGRIRKQDVLDAAAPAAAAPAAAPSAPSASAAVTPTAPSSDKRGRTEKITRLRKVIAERMVESLQTSAQLTTVIEVDLTKIVALRKRVKNDFSAREGVNLTFLPFIAKASIEALKQFPQVNASLNMEEGTVTYFDHENLGIAVDTERGLLVPVIRDAGDLNIAGIARKIADLAARTRENKVTPEELSDGTFTITNTGSRGALFDTPIVNPPQVAILGTGAIVKRPVVITDDAGQDVIAIRSMMYLALSYDHRLVDGADASRFLGAVRARLEEGAFESELGL